MKLKKVLENKEAKQEVLRVGQTGEFWHILREAIDDSIDYLQGIRDGEEIGELSAAEYKVQSEVLKAKIANLRKLKELPNQLIEYMQEPDQTMPNFDPYYTAKEIQIRMHKGEEI